jgi:UPF0755 protein
MRRFLQRFLLLALFLLLLFSSWFALEFSRIPKAPQQTAVFEIESGQGAKSLVRVLKEEGIIHKKWVFLLGHSLLYAPKSIKAGEFSLSLPLSVNQLLRIFTEGKALLYPLTVPEGLTRMETAELLESLDLIDKQTFLQASADSNPILKLDPKAKDLEGYLFPETYHFPKDVTAETIIASMVAQFKTVFTDEWKSRAEELGMSVRDVVILASLIEKETSLPEERALVSSVFHNRLRIDMKLDCDPTIIYALKQEGQFKGRLRTNDLKLDSPYNTYRYGGLPPGPIANPGREAIAASLYPAETDYLYFVSKNEGSHHFSRSIREHINAVNLYQKK